MSVGVDSSEKRTPETIEFYNITKCGVDVADPTARQYSVKTGTRRWPVAVFYNNSRGRVYKPIIELSFQKRNRYYL